MTADLLLVDLKRVTVLHIKLRFVVNIMYDRIWYIGARVCATETYGIWRICWLNTHSLEQESNRGCSLALTLTERIHELLQVGSSLDLEEHLIVAICHFDVQMLRWLRWLAASTVRRLIILRHVEERRSQSDVVLRW